ncbi:peptidase inhibitor 16-like [Littorina saxatilis]|uniref:SCP domain-containing protein n=1 Tax=Littorina saxatilis TaxID=31220 RepID=A0AAN9B7Y7_9CAEN
MSTHTSMVVVPLMALLLLLSLRATLGQTAPDSGMDTKLKDTIVRVHNNYRTMVKASNMLGLRWSDYLETKAADWVSKCDFKHQADPQWGENIYRSEFDRPVTSIVFTGMASWNLERSFMGITSCCDAIVNSTLCCNYQQTVWSQTRDVGCALKKCPSLTATDKKYDNAWFFACYYSPRGNVAGVSPFKKGTPCADCPYTYDQCKKGLCYPSKFCKGDL